jgi:PAS domain S-box-containing protein
VVTLSLALLLSVSAMLEREYSNLELEQQKQDMDHAMTALNGALDTILIASLDYSVWDDTYYFAQTPNQAYIDSNMVNTTYQSFSLDLIIISNFSGVLYSGLYDVGTEQVVAPPQQMVTSAMNVIQEMSVPPIGAVGLVWLDGQRSVMACMPILRSSGAGPSQGWFIMVDWVDAEFEGQLSAATGYPITFVSSDNRLSYSQLQEAQNGNMVPLLISGNSAVLVTGLKDMGGQPFSLYEMSVDRQEYQQGQVAVGLLWQSVAFLGAVLLVIFLLLMQIVVVKRVEDLDRQVGAAHTITGDSRMKVSGDDEISHLATSINGMLESIESSYSRLGDEKKRYHNMIDTQEEAITRLDQDLRIIIHNAAFAELAVRTNVEGRDFFESLGLEEEGLKGTLGEMREGGPALSREFQIKREGETRYQRWTFSALFAGPRREYQAIGADVTVMKKEEEELAQYRQHLEIMVEERTRELYLVNAALQEEIVQRSAAEGRYRGVVEDQTELVFRFQPGGEITFSNGAYRRFNGGESWLDLDERGEEDMAGAVRALAEGMDIAQARVMARSSGEARELSMTLRAIREAGRMKEVQAVARDITETSLLEKEKTRAMQMEWLGIISAALAHEINNLMMTALGKIRLAEKSKDIMEAQALLRDAEQSVMRSGRTTRRLLAFSRGGEPMREVILVPELLRMAVESYEGPTSRVVLEPAEGSVAVDKAQMSEALAAIIKDGLEASAPSGLVHVGARRDGSIIEIRIRDEGQGMPPEVLAKAFEPFFTTHEGRVGLGLPTAALIVEKHGGTIEASSTIGKGTEFRIRLREDVSKEDVTPAPTPRGARVLLMDDDEAILEVVQSLMEDEGFEIDTALDGMAAFDLYQRAMADRPYDVVIMDLLVHRGMGGKDAIRKVLEIDPKAKVIVASGYSDDPVMANFRDYGFCAALYKPYRIEDLVAAIHLIREQRVSGLS